MQFSGITLISRVLTTNLRDFCLHITGYNTRETQDTRKLKSRNLTLYNINTEIQNNEIQAAALLMLLQHISVSFLGVLCLILPLSYL